MTTITHCGPSNCNGCCWSDTICTDGKETGTCGNHGQECQTCIDAKNKYSACVADDAGLGGTCLGGATCTSKNCLGGCCNGAICMLGDQDTACSFGTCVDYTAQGGMCENHACKLPHH